MACNQELELENEQFRREQQNGDEDVDMESADYDECLDEANHGNDKFDYE